MQTRISRPILRNAAGGLAAAALLAACSTSEPKSPIQLGLVVSKTGVLSAVGTSFERTAQLAVDNINRFGGINGHPLSLIVKDDATDPPTAAVRLQELIDEGAVGEVGPIISGAVAASYPIARDHQFPIMSPSSTAPSLSTVSDGGFMFRDVPDDSVQGLAMTYYLTSVADPPLMHAAIVYEDTTYGSGLADAFQTAYAKVGGVIDGRVNFAQGGPAGDAAKAEHVMDQLEDLATHPTLIILVAVDHDAAAIVGAWDARPAWRNTQWFFSDSVRSSAFLAAMPTSCAGMLGTAPTFPTLGDAYSVLQEAYAAEYPTMQLDQEPYAPNVWDVVYLFASALVAQDAAGEPFGGAALRDRLTQVSRAPGLILHAGQWRDIIGTVRRGNDVDYDGASGPVDLDANGQAVGPYEVWKIAAGSAAYTFQQALFLDAKQIIHLQGL